MTIIRSNIPGWAAFDELTSSQINALDINVTNALDKRSGGDTLSGIIQGSGPGRVVEAQVAGTDANTTFTITTGANIVFGSSTMTTNRTYTLSNSGAVAGDKITIWSFDVTHSLTVNDATSTTLTVLGPATSDIYPIRSSFSWINGQWKLASEFSHHPTLVTLIRSTSGTFVIPSNVHSVIVTGCGGGGGGGGGVAPTGVITNTYIGGGGGGGGAQISTNTVSVVPGETATITVGVGGLGGVASTTAVGNNGSGGATSSFSVPSGGIANFPNGQGGSGGVGNLATGTYAGGALVPGGSGVQSSSGALTRAPRFSTTALADAFTQPLVPGQGGFGQTSNESSGTWAPLTSGMRSTTGFAGGSVGSSGSTTGSFFGGGTGGGGGGGAFGLGGDAGTGGNANGAGSGGNGTAGIAAAANTGGGGGGGGGGGAGSAGSGTAGGGGNGGSGFITINYVI